MVEGDFMMGSDYLPDLFTPSQNKAKLSRREKRQLHQGFTMALRDAEDPKQGLLQTHDISVTLNLEGKQNTAIDQQGC